MLPTRGHICTYVTVMCMRLVSVDPKPGEGGNVQTAYNFRLYDDNGEPMKWVKSVSFKVNPSEQPEVVMVIERYVMKDDEIDIDVHENWVQMTQSIPAPDAEKDV